MIKRTFTENISENTDDVNTELEEKDDSLFEDEDSIDQSDDFINNDQSDYEEEEDDDVDMFGAIPSSIMQGDLQNHVTESGSNGLNNDMSLPSIGGNPFLGTKRSRGRPPLNNTSTNDDSNKSDKDDDDLKSLYEWCEDFRYQPAVEYLRITRKHPTLWEGMTIAGFLQDIYEPIDEQWLAENWGGGTYKLEAYQMDKAGKTRIKSHKIVMISGVPTHFADESGNSRRLPKSHLSSRSDEMLIGRNRMGGVNRFRNSSEHQSASSFVDKRANGSASAVELLKLAQANSQDRQTNDKSLEILRLAQHDFQNQMSETTKIQQELYKEMLENQRNELDRMRLEQDKVVQNAQKPLSEALNLMNTRVEQESSSLKEHIQRLEAEHRERVSLLKEELTKQQNNFLREKDELKNAHKDFMDALVKENQEREKLLIKEHNEREKLYRLSLEKASNDLNQRELEWRQRESEIRQHAQASSSENFSQIRLQMDSMRDGHSNQITTLQNEHSRKVSELYKEMSLIRDDARTRESDLRQDFQNREQRLINEHHKSLTDARNDYSDRLDTLRNDYDKRERDKKDYFEKLERDLKSSYDDKEKSLRESLENKYSATISNLNDKITLLSANSDEKVRSALSEFNRKEEHLKTVLQTSFDAQIRVVESERDRLKADLESVRDELKSIRTGIVQEKDPIAKLAEIKSFRENLKTYGFLPDDEHTSSKSDSDDEEYRPRKVDAPKDFLGKIAHYGPSIAQNLITPILARVDNATAVANDAISTQRIELENQSRMLQMQQSQFESEQRKAQLEYQQNLEMNQQLSMQRKLAEKRQTLEDRRRVREGIVEENEEQSLPSRTKIIPRRRAIQIPQNEEPDYKKELDNPIEMNIVEHEDMANNNPYEKLADFLNENILERNDPKDVANKLKTASMMKLIPSGVLENAINQPFESLYGEVQKVSMSKGYSKLSSPRGLSFCQQVYTNLKS